MKTMTSAQIRQAFVDFYVRNGHASVSSSSLVPIGDRTLLFTNAGMVQFKDMFLGLEKRDYSRAVTSQKCMRVSGKHNDLENVGPSPRHHTFFEMLGNFSFGDYFKRDAIRFAWTFLTQELGLPADRLWPTIYLEDDEAFKLWQEVAGVPAERISRLGKKDNFWSMGETGPCGPCSEIMYDRGLEHCTCGRADCNPTLECERWSELWNLVFMQFNAAEDGTVSPLPRPSIDTGMGLERISAVMQEKNTNYDTDLFLPMIRRTQEMLHHSDEQMQKGINSYRVIADHGRAITFLIGDGVIPGNEGRNYVLRLILRRAARHGRLLGFTEPFLTEIAQVVIDTMGPHYQELATRRDFILRVIQQEEERFQQTLSVGLSLLDELMVDLAEKGETVISGQDAFRLYDTYGFPLDLTREVGLERGFKVDEAGFRAAMTEQRERARAAQHFAAADADQLQVYIRALETLQDRELLGANGVEHIYDETVEVDTNLICLIKDGQLVQSAKDGDAVEVILPVTPFYVEGGGQVSDTGLINHAVRRENEEVVDWEIEVTDMKRPIPGLIVHVGTVVSGEPRENDPVWAAVDLDRRWDIARNHTATHLLHAALRQVLGEHAQQAGSRVEADRLRFDFTHSAMLTQDELQDVEQIVNESILANYPLESIQTNYQDAVSRGAIALFNEKYGDVVRMIQVGPGDAPVSQELCGGTHVGWTSEIGLFHVVSEGSVGSGLRRIEAVTGRGAQRLVQQRLATLDSTAAFLGCRPDEVDRKVLGLLDDVQKAQREASRLRRRLAKLESEALLSHIQDVQGVRVLAVQVDAADADNLREISDWFRERMQSGVIVLGAVFDSKPNFVAVVTPDLVERGLHAGKLVKAVAQAVGGGGGGKPNLAQAGGRDASRLPQALKMVLELVAQQLS
jgi:alanyl-tRNA synthetase